MEAKCEYQVGDLAWARMGTYPFWPCIITRDPLSGTFVKKKLFGRIEHDVLHVTFFGDNGRRGWIVDNMLRKFLGRLEFETERDNYTVEEKKRDPKLYGAFFISEKKQTQWSISVDEAEALMREPKRLRIDILRDMLVKSQCSKTTPKIERSKKVTRTNSDVSLSESLYDTLFSEDDSKTHENERSRSKTRNKSLDVSEVVTACLDNMAAKTGITKIQRQSHMDRWLQKAKSKTPEKSLLKAQTTPKIDKDSKTNNKKHKRSPSKESSTKKSLSLRRRRNESQDDIEIKLLSHQNEHDYSKKDFESDVNNDNLMQEVESNKFEELSENVYIGQVDSSIGSVESVGNYNKDGEESDVHLTVVNEELIETESDHNIQLLPEKIISEFNDIESTAADGDEVVLESMTKSNENLLTNLADQDDFNEINNYGTNVNKNDTVLDNNDFNQIEKMNYDDCEDGSVDSTTNLDECQRMDLDVNDGLEHEKNAAGGSADEQTEDTEESDCDGFQSSEDNEDLDSNISATLTESTVVTSEKYEEMDDTSAGDYPKTEDISKHEEEKECYDAPTVNGDVEPNRICDTALIDEKAFLDERSNRTSVAETESMDSDNTEELLSSNDPQSEIDPVGYNSKANVDPKSIENNDDSVSVTSETNSEISEFKHRTKPKHGRPADKHFTSLKSGLEDPEFLKYLELRQDALIDENPSITQEEITNYLYKTWLYEESSKSERKRTDDIEQAALVKGLNQEPVQPKKPRKRIKVNKEIYNDEDGMPKAKSKRKIIRPYYNEDYSDLDSDFEMYEMFNSKPNSALKSTNAPLENGTVDGGNCNEAVLLSGDDYDQVEEYFDQLTRPKPNLFKGLIRERVCEICERSGNLVKCKGCHSTFHTECTKKETEAIEAQLPTRGRKKKKRNRGRKRKSTEDSNGADVGSQSDERSPEDQNQSLDEIVAEPRIVVDADEAETRLCAAMRELFDQGKEYLSDSSENELSWSDAEAGKCRIVDVPLPSKRRAGLVADVDFRCNGCSRGDEPACFVCKSARSPRDGAEYRQRCQVAHCHRRYHQECLEHWPQTQLSPGGAGRSGRKPAGYFEPVTCPRHVCHTCVSDDPRGCKTRFSGDKLARCVRCPATYHTFTKCLPAGTQVLTGSAIVCPRHYEHRPGKVPCHVNTGWCFICALGGSLICCEYCPTSFHAECLNIKPPEGGYMCEDCETGRLPLYGEMVWVKLGHYRWWPGIILHPSEIPANIMAVKHSPGEFVVRFFGQYDHYWVNRGRVFPFQEGDSGKLSSQKSKIDVAFSMAMEHAQRACEILKTVEPNEEESLDIASSLLPPHYVKLKVNKPCGSLVGRRPDAEASLTQCDCGPDDEDPCGPYSQCLNRMLLTECGPCCRAGPRCNNRAFERREYPRLTPYRTPQRGWGLKTLDHIRAGQFVIEYVGELIDEEEFKRRMVRKHEIRDENYYFLTLDKERMIDAGPKGNLARFMNHCCEPNCETQKWTVLGDIRVGLFALRDIPPNSEVTFNYNLQCAGIEKKRCLCGAKRCSGYMGAKPKQNEPQPKKPRKDPTAKRAYRKRKNVELSPVGRGRPPKRRVSRSKPRELTDIERDLLIIRSATDGMSSDEESTKDGQKRKRPRTLYDEPTADDGGNSPSAKRSKTQVEVGD
ncbi:unnamed protein product, partial [Iphiclides podalirius]